MVSPKKKPAKKIATKKKVSKTGLKSPSNTKTAKKAAPVKKRKAATKISALVKSNALSVGGKVVAKKRTITKKKVISGNRAVSKKKIGARKIIVPITETPVSIKQKDTIRKNIAEREEKTKPSPVAKRPKERKKFFKKIKGLRTVRNYDPHHIQLNKIKKGGPKPSGKKPLW